MTIPENPESGFNKMIISIEEIDFTKVPEKDRATTMVFCLSLIGMFNDHIRNNDHKAAQHVYEVVNLMTRTWEKRDPVFWQRQLEHLMRRKLFPIGVVAPKATEMPLSDAIYLSARVATIINEDDGAVV